MFGKIINRKSRLSGNSKVNIRAGSAPGTMEAGFGGHRWAPRALRGSADVGGIFRMRPGGRLGRKRTVMEAEPGVVGEIWEAVFTAGPPLLSQRPRKGTLSAAAVRSALAAFDAGGDPTRFRILAGLALLWHDHWDEAHAIAQSREGERDFDLLHAILHRREG